MADIKDILSSLLKAKGNVDSFKKSIESLKDLKAEVGVDLKSIRNVEKLESAMRSLVKAQEDMNEAEKKALAAKDSNTAEYEAQLKIYEQSEKKVNQYTKVLKENAAKQLQIHEELQKAALEEGQSRVEAWKKNSLAGKSYSALSSNIAKATAGFGLAAAGMKALGRFTDAARLRNNIMIASYGSLKDNLAGATISTFRYESAMRGAQATAKYLGMENEDISDMMIKYQRIVGKATPEALGNLTEATLATAKVMGINGAQAIEYVQGKMDNFGGTAQQALDSLKDLRGETEKYNTSLQGVSIRGDDVVKTIQDITNSNNVYAVDQRFLAQTLMRTSATLQANGESYNYAQKMANNYTKSLSSEAPEWMKITNSFDITKEVMKGIDPKKVKDPKTGKMVSVLTKEMSDKLEKAKPGLSKKVTDLLNAGYSQYDTTRLLGETLGDTQVGMDLMSKKIVDLGKSSITTLATVYGKSYMEAEEMYKAALRSQELEKNTRILKEGSVEEQKALTDKMKETLGMSDAEIANAMKNADSQKALLELYADKNAIAQAGASIEQQRTDAIQKQHELANKLKQQEAELQKMKASGASASAIALQQNLVDETKKAKDAQDALVKKGQENAKIGDQGSLKSTTEGVKDTQQATSILTGDYFKAGIEQLSSPIGLLLAGSTAFFLSSTANQLLQNAFLAKIAGGSSATGAATEILKDIAGKGAGKASSIGSAALGGLKTIGGYFGTGAGGLGGAGSMTAGGIATSVAGVAAAGYGGYKLGEKIMNTDFGKKHLTGDFSSAAISDEEAFAIADARMREKRKKKKKQDDSATYMKTTSNNGNPPVPSDRSRESLVKTNVDQNVQQAQTVQKALQATAASSEQNQQNQNGQAQVQSTPQGAFGPLNPDGSVSLTINNFMDVFGTALAQAKTR